MKQSWLSTYVATVMAVAAGLTAWLANDYPLVDGTAWFGVLMWSLAVGPQTVSFPRQRVQISVSDCFVFYGMVVHGPLGAVTAAFAGTLGAMQLGDRKANRTQAAFNLGAVPLSAALAAWVFEALGSAASLTIAVLAAASVFALVNTLLVAAALGLEGKPASRRLFSFPALAFIGSVFATAAAGTVLATLSAMGPGDWMVAGVVIVGFLGGKILTTLRDRSDELPVASALRDSSTAQPAT